MRSTRLRLMARPRPVPDAAAAWLPTCENGSKSLPISSGAMPTPVSLTEKRIAAPAAG